MIVWKEIKIDKRFNDLNSFIYWLIIYAILGQGLFFYW
jgi:hypothetical protein